MNSACNYVVNLHWHPTLAISNVKFKDIGRTITWILLISECIYGVINTAASCFEFKGLQLRQLLPFIYESIIAFDDGRIFTVLVLNSIRLSDYDNVSSYNIT